MDVEGKVLGGRRPLFAGWSVPPPVPDEGGEVRLRDLIARIVRAEVAAFRERQEERGSRDSSRRTRSAGARSGARSTWEGGRPPGTSTWIGPSRRPLTAFEDGIYLVLVDDREVRGLDAAVAVGEETRVTFLRLALLAGG